MGLGKEATSLHDTLKRCCYRSTCSHLLFTLGFTNSCLYFSYPTPSALLLLPFFPHSQPCRVKAVASFCLLPDLKLQLLPLVPGPPLRLGMVWAVAVQSCSTVLGFPAPQALSHSTELLLRPAGAGSCLAALGLCGGQKQLQHWSLTVLGSAVASSCIFGNAYGSGNVQ